MKQTQKILQELNDLNSQLVPVGNQNCYEIPAGYFETLIGEVMNRIRALEAENPKDELSLLSPLINDIKRQMPYHVPEDFFSGLAEKTASIGQSPQAELATISPYLSRLKKETPYPLPNGYFDTLNIKPVENAKSSARVISLLSRKWFRYAAAAVVVGVIIVAGILINQRNNDPDTQLAKLEKQINIEIKKSSSEELTEFLQYTDAGLNGTEKALHIPDTEIRELLKDITDAELKKFLEETSDEGPGSETLIFN